MDVAEVAHEPETPLMRWTAEEFIDLLESGAVENRRIELLNGSMVKEMPQGKLHSYIFLALQRAFAAIHGVESGLVTSPTLQLSLDTVVEPEFALLQTDATHRLELPTPNDVRWVIEVSVTSRRKDLTTKKDAYAQANIAHYWVFDAARRGTWIFSEPKNGDYAAEIFVPAGETVTLPILGTTLDTGTIFPPVEP